MRSNFLKQKAAMVGEVDKKIEQADDEDKENKSQNSEAFSTQKDYHKEGFVEPLKQELSPAEKEALAKQREEEAIQKIIEKQRTQRQMCYLSLESDVFKIY